MTVQKKPREAVNEFNQYLKPVSLWTDAWRRLRRNRMALVSLWVVLAYIAVSLAAPLLAKAGLLYDYTEQVIDHVNLPPSFRPAGQLAIERFEERAAQLEEALAGRGGELSDAQDDYLEGYESLEAEVEGMEGEEFAFEFGYDATGVGEVEGAEDADLLSIESGSNFSFSYGETESADIDSDPLAAELDRARSSIARLESELAMNEVHARVYLLGTDDLGRDMFSRVLMGGRISIMIGIVGALTAVAIGIVVGAIAGYVGGAVDNFLMRFVDIMYSLPYLLVVIIIMSMVGNQGRGSIVILFVAIALVSWLTISRVVRGQIISLKNSEFVEAARSMGAGPARIIFRHLLPNTLGIIVVWTTLSMPAFIMNESFLSFLGLGVSAPDASWGTLVSEGVRGMTLRPWQLVGPAIAMTIFLFCMNFLGDGLRDALDPQSKNRG